MNYILCCITLYLRLDASVSRRFHHCRMDVEGSYSGGHRLTFVGDVPDSLLCIFCHFPSRDTQLSACCGYNMCRSCLDNYKESITLLHKILTCPKCCHYDFKAYPNKMSDREIYNLMVVCSNGKAGCKWRGNLNELTVHLEDTCLFEMVECPKGCRLLLQRRDIALHAKSNCSQLVINCPHCLVRGKKHFIEGQHLEECSKAPLSCPNHCGASVSSEDMSKHRKVCPLEVVSCEYNDLGCDTDMARQDVEVHNREFIAKHLNLAKQKLVCSTKELQLSKMQLISVEKEHNAFKSTVAYTAEEVLAMIKLLGQLNLAQDKAQKINILRQINLFYNNVFALQGNQTAPVILRMDNFVKRRKNGTMWCSPPFFTHTQGYRLCLCVFAGGHKVVQRRDHISVFVAVMEGPHDSQLTWPMEGIIHVYLLNQLHSVDSDLSYFMAINLPDTPLFPIDSVTRVTMEDKSISTPKGMMSSCGIGATNFVPLDKLMSVTSVCQFLKNDCIFLKVEYESQSDDVGSPKTFAYKQRESDRRVRQNSQQFYRQPHREAPSVVMETPALNSPQNRPSDHPSPRGSGGGARGSHKVIKIPEADTRL